MASRRDQVDAQRHMMARVTGALVLAEPETSESPTRRDRTGTIAGVVLGVLLLAGIGVWALFPGSSGSTRWQQANTLVVDASTGARYVLASGRLRPVNDLGTATLLAGGRLTPVTVASSQLAKVPRGEPVGSADGPQVLPPKRINQRVWRVCDQGAAGLAVHIDVPVAPSPLGPDEALTVTAAGRTHLLWGGRRMLLGQVWVAHVLGLGLSVPTPVDPSWLDLIPPAGTVGPPVVPGAGERGRTVAGRRTTVGDMFRVDLGSTIGHYLMTTEGLAPLTDTEYLLERARPGSTGEATITAADLAANARDASARPLTTLPVSPPKPRATPDGAAVCLEYSGRSQGPAVVLTAATAAPAATDGPVRAAGSGKPRVAVRVLPGGGALLRPPGKDPAWPAQQRPHTLIDERGVAYQVAVVDLAALGYSADQAVVMPTALVSLLPIGPTLVRPGGG
ncbi:type VII secretion protein EccB [Micromonospora sp. RTGN7]|uniref:type VII secretion protein EccB n=1 Tax=Micromonospora sp. RTGN7 TaxID=3016526 RepID=UPI0029FF3B7B|nr:type VII secretion protein EccB [Micromonospora sp. RTGN7]